MSIKKEGFQKWISVVVNGIFIIGLLSCLILYFKESNFMNQFASSIYGLKTGSSFFFVNDEIRSYTLGSIIVCLMIFVVFLFCAIKGKHIPGVSFIEALLLSGNYYANIRFSSPFLVGIDIALIVSFVYCVYSIILSIINKISKKLNKNKQVCTETEMDK